MSEATGLSIVIEPKNALAVFTQPDHIESILQQVEKEVNSFVPDVSTKKGRDAIASLGLKVAKTKTYLDGLGKDLVTEYKEVPKKIDASRKTVRDRLDALKEKVLLPKLEFEAEQERLKLEAERIAAEQRKAQETADRIQREAKQKEDARLAEEKRVADEAAKRAADVEHRRTINRQAVTDLIANGLPEDCAQKCVAAIAKNLIASVRITY
ncbi:TPA: hypothetical protein ACPZS9_000128 [Yersinia enterocolitica]